MSALGKFTKLFGVIEKSFEIVGNYLTEPLREWEHNRSEAAKASSHEHSKDMERSRIHAQTEARIREEESKARLVTEAKRIERELEEWVKDQEITRFERVTEAVMRYRQQFVDMNTNAIAAIGNMQIELRRKAQDLVEEKKRRYIDLQKEALDDAMSEFSRIEQQFGGNPAAKMVLERAVEKKLTMIIDGSGLLINELIVDLKSLSESITRLADRGEQFVEGHLQRFHMRQLGDIEEVPSSETKLIGKP